MVYVLVNLYRRNDEKRWKIELIPLFDHLNENDEPVIDIGYRRNETPRYITDVEWAGHSLLSITWTTEVTFLAIPHSIFTIPVVEMKDTFLTPDDLYLEPVDTGYENRIDYMYAVSLKDLLLLNIEEPALAKLCSKLAYKLLDENTEYSTSRFASIKLNLYVEGEEEVIAFDYLRKNHCINYLSRLMDSDQMALYAFNDFGMEWLGSRYDFYKEAFDQYMQGISQHYEMYPTDSNDYVTQIKNVIALMEGFKDKITSEEELKTTLFLASDDPNSILKKSITGFIIFAFLNGYDLGFFHDTIKAIVSNYVVSQRGYNDVEKYLSEEYIEEDTKEYYYEYSYKKAVKYFSTLIEEGNEIALKVDEKLLKQEE